MGRCCVFREVFGWMRWMTGSQPLLFLPIEPAAWERLCAREIFSWVFFGFYLGAGRVSAVSFPFLRMGSGRKKGVYSGRGKSGNRNKAD